MSFCFLVGDHINYMVAAHGRRQLVTMVYMRMFRC